jgi:signal transduction histidine kinase
MATLLLLQGTGAGMEYPLADDSLTIGRQPDVGLLLNQDGVSRKHARVTREADRFFLEDLSSSNGTFVNGQRLTGRSELHDGDEITIDPYLFRFRKNAVEPNVVASTQLSLNAASRTTLQQGAGDKLFAVLDITRHLARSLDLDELLPRLLEQLLRLFPQADRGLVLIQEGGQLRVRALRTRRPDQEEGPTYSRSVVRRVLEEGVSVVAEDAGADERFAAAETLRHMGVRSFLCVPLTAQEGPARGVLQLDCWRPGKSFNATDLNLLATIAMQVSVVLENAALHADVLEQERLKRDLALARIGQLAAGMAHEINNPLAFIRNNLAVLRRDVGVLRELLQQYQEGEAALAEREPALLQSIRARAQEVDAGYMLSNLDPLLVRSGEGLRRIGEIVQSLRDFARLDQSDVDEVDLNAGIEATLVLLRARAEKQQVTVELDLGPHVGVVCSPAKINQVVYHLVANGIDACAAGGKVTVRTRNAANGVELQVHDTGSGIAAAIRDRIFDPFFTTKPLGKGMGLGLSLSHGIVQEHGGRIDFESTVGQGTCFKVWLPASRTKNQQV